MAYDEERRSRRASLARGGLDSGEDTGRILALSDGVFAFAMTLLVINLAVPTGASLAASTPGADQNAQLAHYLEAERTSFFAYGLAFFVIGSWWIVHHRIFRWVEKYNRTLMAFNLVFLLFIAITPFVVGLLANFTGSSVAVSFYAGAQALAGVSLVAMLAYLYRAGRELMDPTTTDLMITRGMKLAAVTPIGFALSIPLAYVDPLAAILSWLGIFAVRAVIVRSFPIPPTPTPLAPQ